jgi:hypothetical protein
MLDTLAYASNTDGSVQKTTTNVSEISAANIAQEITCLQAQLTAFQAGAQTSDIVAAIANYTAQIAFLQGL